MPVRLTRHRYATADRFAAPRPTGSLATPGTAAICPQPVSRLDAVTGSPKDVWPQSEDCLWLAVAAPDEPAPPRPVIVFLHGGGFGTGAGLLGWYDGTVLAGEHDVIVIGVNYRVGPFGYLVRDGVSEGNLGLLDQVAALRWIGRHVAEFGGDPDNVTVTGQSAGAMSIDAMLEQHTAQRPLFRRAIMHSGPSELIRRDRADAEIEGERFVSLLGADPRAAPVDALLAAFAAAAPEHAARVGNRVDPVFCPTRGTVGIAVQVEPARLDGLEVVVGVNADEMTAFGYTGAEAAALSEEWFAEPLRRRAADLRGLGATVHEYYFDWRPTGSPFGATHCLELPLLLGDEQAWSGAPMLGTQRWREVDERGRRWRAAWAQFAKTGAFTDPT